MTGNINYAVVAYCTGRVTKKPHILPGLSSIAAVDETSTNLNPFLK